MPDRLDEAIRTMVTELVKASPPPPPATLVVDRTVRHRRSWAWWLPLRPAILAAALVVVVGAGGVLLGRHVFPASRAADEQVRVVAGDRAPEPGFSNEAMGSEVLLLPASDTVAPNVGPDLVGDVVAVGRVAESDIEVFTWRIGSEGVEGVCVEVVGPRARETACSASASAPELHTPSTFSNASSEPVRTVVTWRVPEGTSVVALEVEGLRLWQRPVGGVAAFIIDRPAFGFAFISGWRADGAALGRIGFGGGELPPPQGAFSEATGAVLVFDDGLSGVVALDLDSGRVERRVVDGQRPGDPEYRLIRVGDHLVVGWGTINALAIDTLEGIPFGKATVFIPAVEPDAVWLIGERAAYRLVTLDGTEIVSSTGLDPAVGYPAHGVPGGVVHETDSGITIWYPDAETVRIPGSGPGFVADVSDDLIAWCEGECTLHLTEIGGGDTVVPSPGPDRSFEPRSARFSPDGRLLAAVIGDPGPIGPDSTGAIAVIDVASGEATVVTGPLLPRPSYIGWSPDGRHLFFSSYSYGQSEMLIGWYRVTDGYLEIVTPPIGGTLSFVVLDRNEASAFFSAP